MKRSSICLLLPLPLALAACTLADVTTRSAPTEVIVVEPTADEIRAEQIRKQREDIDALRDALADNRSRAESETARSSAETRQAQSEIRALQAKLAEIAQNADASDTRSDAEKLEAQSQIRTLQAQLREVTARADAVDKRSDAEKLRAQSEIRTLQAQLGEVKARADAASAQSDKAFAIATEFLSNLVAAREEQRSIVERNISTFGGMEHRLAEIENRISETRQLSQAEIAATRNQSTELEQRLIESDTELTALREQLLQVHRQNEETRASLDSGPMLQMLRQLEGTQRDTSGLRGAFEEMQQEQEAARKRMQNYYLDLDARIQTLQAKERAAREAELANTELLDSESTAVDEAMPPAEDSAAEDSFALDPAVPDDADLLPAEENAVQSPEVAPTQDAAGEGDVDASGEVTGDSEPKTGQSDTDNKLPDVQMDEPDEISVETLPDTIGTENISGMDAPAGEVTNADLEVRPGQSETANSLPDVPLEVPVDVSADALPDIVDTVDIVPGEPVSASENALQRNLDEAPVDDLNDEFNPGEPEASLPDSVQRVAQSLAQIAATDVDLDVRDQQESAIHAVIVTDWSVEY